ncbi:Stk1 family PASTA domain-containing Ser/Thr kinase [Streptomyces sp. DSM 42041]|uniref:non-specific serine/threonine protein kinase n=1 Tax=Streptomyces hazeniae TaxID=3075538 RepID=A0ABU2NVN2_9ACTN|nr:Stk1 family PASTA domain-containing Ser/Thr kinase [Streptomyces sp. DSM 42041]MDT0381041.1 Stk1 family PASTA domain-containing Ser/Thr kinase [Streptomyces sp. DSM 42041]
MDTTLQDPLIGHVLDGRYRVDARIAVGGMATVYRALDMRLDRVCALKVMHAALADDQVFVARFIREARSAARLAHHNVVGVFDQGTDGGHVYLAMEYVDGCTLRDVLRERGALQPRAALDVLEPMLAALGAAHRAGLVHRDMKPENVLIGDDGRVKVADFGLVGAVDGQTSTNTESLLGTVSYLAPEQIEHGVSDTRTDLYACGVVLYEMLTGSKPHSGGTPAQVLYQRLQADVAAPSGRVPGLAPALDALVARAAARDPERRPADAVALLSEVRSVRAGLTDAQLDVVPPEARNRTQAGAENLTTVLPRPVDDDRDPSPVERTARFPSPPLDPPEETDGSRHRAARRRGPRRPLLVVLGAVLAVLLGTGVWYINSGQFIRTPSVLSLTEGDARAKLRDAGLEVRVERDHSLTVDRGRVMESDPSPGERIRRNGAVTVVVSRGPEVVKVPDLSGTPLDDARRELKGLGLEPGLVIRRFDEEVAQGAVVSTEPAAGTESRTGSAVRLTVSKGREIEVPDVSGQDVASARETLREAGLDVRIAPERVFSEEEKGTIAVQSPEPGAVRGGGETVTLTVSKGPDLVAVPDVESMSADEARSTLEGAGFEVRIRRIFLGDTVFNQNPDPGEQAPRGSEITLWVR